MSKQENALDAIAASLIKNMLAFYKDYGSPPPQVDVVLELQAGLNKLTVEQLVKALSKGD